MKKLFSLLVLLCTCSVLFASEIDGKWTATIETDNGEFTFYADYVVKDGKLTGTLSSDMGSVDIEEGTADGNTFKYVFYIDYNKIVHKGKVEGDKIKITSSGDMGESEIEMKRVKKE